MAKPKALELLALGGFGLLAYLPPAYSVYPLAGLQQLLLPLSLLFPPVIVGDRAPVARTVRRSSSCGH